MKRTRLDDTGQSLTMTPERLARRLDALALDVVKVQHALRRLAAFLDREPIELDHDTLRTVACRLVDLGTRVRVGSIAIVAHRDESIEQPTLPLFDGPIAPEASPDAIPDAIGDPEPKRGRKPVAQYDLFISQTPDGPGEWIGRVRCKDMEVARAAGKALFPGLAEKVYTMPATARYGQDAVNKAADSDWPEESREARAEAIGRAKAAGVKLVAFKEPEPPTEDTDGQASQRSIDGQSDGVDSLEGIEASDVGATDGLAADADAWRSVPLARILPESLADALNLDWEIETLDDLHQTLSNGETLEDLSFTPAETELVRDAVRTLRAELGWGPEDGIPAAWLEPKAPDGTNPVPAEEIDGALHHILYRNSKVGDRWWTLKQSGADDAALKDALRSAFGTGQKVAFQFQTTCSTYRGGKSPAFWYGWHCGLDGGKPEPTLAGADLVARVRQLLEIPWPAQAPKPAGRKKGAASAHA